MFTTSRRENILVLTYHYYENSYSSRGGSGTTDNEGGTHVRACAFFILSVNDFLTRNFTTKRQFQRTTSEIILDSGRMSPKPFFFLEMYGKNLRLLARNCFYKRFLSDQLQLLYIFIIYKYNNQYIIIIYGFAQSSYVNQHFNTIVRTIYNICI